MRRYKRISAYQRWGPSTTGFDHPLLAAKEIFRCPNSQSRDVGRETAGNLANVG